MVLASVSIGSDPKTTRRLAPGASGSLGKIKEPSMPLLLSESTLTPNAFVSEVAEFQETLADPAMAHNEKARAYARIVKHAASLDPHDPGFERAGVALKEALCAWLCVQPGNRH
jgi:hypothetical protein